MDNLGIDRLIEMIEARYGKFVGDGLLLLIVLGIGSAAIHYTLLYAIFPLTDGLFAFFKMFSDGVSEERVHKLVFATLVGLLWGTAGALYMHLRAMGWMHYFQKEKKAALDEVEERERDIKKLMRSLEEMIARDDHIIIVRSQEEADEWARYLDEDSKLMARTSADT